jgi:4-amino-4-deoxy-L-arabinose transferase-like glycosyltransferase
VIWGITVFIIMKAKFNSLKSRLAFYSLWMTSLLVQAYCTEISADEAYYWMYANKLAWGYFDHPPLIALVIKVGYFILPNELGVRLIPVILNLFTIILIEQIIKPKDIRMFFMLVFSIGVLHFFGFLALPDSPLLFCFAAYLLLYKEFLVSPSIRNSLLSGVVIALMFYSKYHAAIIVTITILSNLRVFSNAYFWLTAVVSFFIFRMFSGKFQKDYPLLTITCSKEV